MTAHRSDGQSWDKRISNFVFQPLKLVPRKASPPSTKRDRSSFIRSSEGHVWSCLSLQSSFAAFPNLHYRTGQAVPIWLENYNPPTAAAPKQTT
jgi:hypothetical protein